MHAAASCQKRYYAAKDTHHDVPGKVRSKTVFSGNSTEFSHIWLFLGCLQKAVTSDLVLMGNVPWSAGCTASSCVCLALRRSDTAFGMKPFDLLPLGWEVGQGPATQWCSPGPQPHPWLWVRIVPMGKQRHFSAAGACGRNRMWFWDTGSLAPKWEKKHWLGTEPHFCPCPRLCVSPTAMAFLAVKITFLTGWLPTEAQSNPGLSLLHSSLAIQWQSYLHCCANSTCVDVRAFDLHRDLILFDRGEVTFPKEKSQLQQNM